MDTKCKDKQLIAEQHYRIAELLAENAARTAQVEALRKQRLDLLRACKDFVFLEKTNMTKKQVQLRIDNTKEVIADVESDY